MSDERNALRNELEILTAFDAPVGFEEPVLRYVCEQLATCCDRVEVDVRGNVYGFQEEGDAGTPLVMLTAHADEIGFMVTSITNSGFLRFARLGQPTPMVLPGQRVRVLASGGALEGVIGVQPGHILHGDAARRVPPDSELYIDVGATSKEDAQKWGIEPGTPATFVGPLVALADGDRVCGKAVDNRAGIVAVLEAARQLRRCSGLPNRRVFVITVEEEIGLRGAAVATMRAHPDVVLAIDTVPAGGTPDVDPEVLPWAIGNGPLLKVRESRGLSTHGPLRELTRRVARELDLPLPTVVDTAGITDGSSAQQAGAQIAALVFGLARRYSHSAAEVLDLRDLETLIRIVVALTGRIEDRQQLMRVSLPQTQRNE